VATTRSRLPLLLALAAASGLLLFLADFPVHAWPLQLVALTPLLVGLHALRPSRSAALLAGVVLGLCHTVPISVALEFPLLLGAALAGYITLFWVLFALGARWAFGWPAPFGRSRWRASRWSSTSRLQRLPRLRHGASARRACCRLGRGWCSSSTSPGSSASSS